MSYREAPPEALENPDDMLEWSRLGQAAARRAAAQRKAPKPRAGKAAASRQRKDK